MMNMMEIAESDVWNMSSNVPLESVLINAVYVTLAPIVSMPPTNRIAQIVLQFNQLKMETISNTMLRNHHHHLFHRHQFLE